MKLYIFMMVLTYNNIFINENTKVFLFSANETVGKVTLKHVYEIAKLKQKDYEYLLTPLQDICKLIIQRSDLMGIRVSIAKHLVRS